MNTNIVSCGREHGVLHAKVEHLEQDKVEQWKAIDGIRSDIKGLFLKIGIVVGSMQAISTIALAILIHYATK